MDAATVDHSAFGREQLLRKAEAMIPVVAERAEQASRDRTVPIQTVNEIKDAGFFRAFQPKRLGGLELDPNTYFDIVTLVGQGCMSSAWSVAVQGSTPFLIAQFSDQAQEDFPGT